MKTCRVQKSGDGGGVFVDAVRYSNGDRTANVSLLMLDSGKRE